VLAASSAVQDGHGMLPLLAESPRSSSRSIVNALAASVGERRSLMLKIAVPMENGGFRPLRRRRISDLFEVDEARDRVAGR
jgi:hypothetical protein